jgi:predicted amidohydrolase YtcJ
MTETTVLNGCTVATMNPERAEYLSGHVVVTSGRIAAVGQPAAGVAVATTCRWSSVPSPTPPIAVASPGYRGS